MSGTSWRATPRHGYSSGVYETPTILPGEETYGF
jgi:hypothetical protein